MRGDELCCGIVREVFENIRDTETNEILYELEKVYEFPHATMMV